MVAMFVRLSREKFYLYRVIILLGFGDIMESSGD